MLFRSQFLPVALENTSGRKTLVPVYEAMTKNRNEPRFKPPDKLVRNRNILARDTSYVTPATSYVTPATRSGETETVFWHDTFYLSHDSCKERNFKGYYECYKNLNFNFIKFSQKKIFLKPE